MAATIPVLGNLFGTPQRVARAMGVDGRRLAHRAARHRQAARVPQGARTAEGPEGRVAEHAPGVHEGARHGAEGARHRRRARRSCGRAPTSTSRACRCRRAGRATPGRSSRGDSRSRAARTRSGRTSASTGSRCIARNKVIMRWLAHRGGALDFRDHALAHAGHARSRSPSRWAPIRRRSWAPSRRCPIRCRNTSSRDCCAAAAPRSSSASRTTCRCRHRRRSCSKASSSRIAHDATGYETARGGSVRRSHRLLQRGRALSGADDRAHHAAPRPDLSLDLHRQAAGRAVDAGRRAERSVRAAAAEAVSGNRRLLPAAGRLLVSPRGRVDEEAVRRATPSA